MLKIHLLAATTSLLLIAGNISAAPTLGQIDDFQDGSAQGWADGGNMNTVVTNVPDSGPGGAGDNAGSVGFISRSVVFNEDARWVGDYSSAGVTGIQLDINNPYSTAVDLRLGLSGPGGNSPGGGGDTWVTNSQVVAPNSGWTTLTFAISAADLLATGSATDATAALAGVRQLRLIDNDSETFVGKNGSLGYELDNITAVPEPTSLNLLALAGVAMLLRRRRS